MGKPDDGYHCKQQLLAVVGLTGCSPYVVASMVTMCSKHQLALAISIRRRLKPSFGFEFMEWSVSVQINMFTYFIFNTIICLTIDSILAVNLLQVISRSNARPTKFKLDRRSIDIMLVLSINKLSTQGTETPCPILYWLMEIKLTYSQ